MSALLDFGLEGKRVVAAGEGKTPALVERSVTEAIYRVGAGRYTFRVLE